MRVLTVNAGSSSLKLRLLEHDDSIAYREVQSWDGDGAPLREFLDEYGADAVGHRVVHGGSRITSPTVVDDSVVRYLDELTDLAPLHQPRAVAGLRAAREVATRTPSVVCVDTAFHMTMPRAATTYAVPRRWNREWSLRRYGFHGLSHQYAISRAAELTGAAPDSGRVVSCHLGAGASLAAVRDGRCVDTTMGFTPSEGLVMNTRSGSLDPGLVGWLVNNRGVQVDELFDKLLRHAGLAGLTESTGDLRDVLSARQGGDDDAALAYEVYRHSLVWHIGAMVAVLGGVDSLVFTGGVGEHQAPLRAELAEALEFLGVRIEPQGNADAHGDANITGQDSAVRVVVVTAREDLEIARQVRAALGNVNVGDVGA